MIIKEEGYRDKIIKALDGHSVDMGVIDIINDLIVEIVIDERFSSERMYNSDIVN